MAYFKLVTFGGLAPKISPRLLGDTLAQTATDVNLENGRLVPIKDNSTVNPSSGVSTLASTTKNAIFKYTDDPERWLQFEDDVNVVRGPVPGDTNDTIYWSGETFPKMGRSSDVLGSAPYPSGFYRLGIPAPTAAPTVAVAAATAINATITTSNGSGTITVTTASDHNAAVDDFVTLSNYSATGGLSADEINGDYKIKSVPSSTTFTVDTNGSASSSTTSSQISNGASFNGPAEALIDFSTSYVYTFVSAYGEEGPPSPASTVVTTDDNQSVNLSGLETSSAKSNTNLSKKRIYRSNTGSNTTDFQFVAEVNLNVATYNDTSTNADLAEVIQSTFHIAPPDDDTNLYPDGPLKGLVSLPNGILAGFTGKRVCFSEPFLPYAWPAATRVTIEEEVVGLAVTANGVVVGTKATPYLITGTEPRSMSVIRIESAEACLNKNSMVDMGNSVIYAGPDGLVLVEGASVQVITEGLITPSQWQASYYPSTIRGFLWEGRYVGFYNTGSGYGGFIFDPRPIRSGGSAQLNPAAFVNLDVSAEIRGGHTDPDDNQLYLIISNAIKKFQGDSSTNLTFNWRSKEYVLPAPMGMAFAKVDAETYPVRVKVYGDGSVIYNAVIASSGSNFTVTGTTPSFSSTPISEPIVRLPSGLHKTYEVEVEGATIVNEVCIAQSIDEIRGA